MLEKTIYHYVDEILPPQSAWGNSERRDPASYQILNFFLAYGCRINHIDETQIYRTNDQLRELLLKLQGAIEYMRCRCVAADTEGYVPNATCQIRGLYYYKQGTRQKALPCERKCVPRPAEPYGQYTRRGQHPLQDEKCILPVFLQLTAINGIGGIIDLRGWDEVASWQSGTYYLVWPEKLHTFFSKLAVIIWHNERGDRDRLELAYGSHIWNQYFMFDRKDMEMPKLLHPDVTSPYAAGYYAERKWTDEEYSQRIGYAPGQTFEQKLNTVWEDATAGKAPFPNQTNLMTRLGAKTGTGKGVMQTIFAHLVSEIENSGWGRQLRDYMREDPVCIWGGVIAVFLWTPHPPGLRYSEGPPVTARTILGIIGTDPNHQNNRIYQNELRKMLVHELGYSILHRRLELFDSTHLSSEIYSLDRSPHNRLAETLLSKCHTVAETVVQKHVAAKRQKLIVGFLSGERPLLDQLFNQISSANFRTEDRVALINTQMKVATRMFQYLVTVAIPQAAQFEHVRSVRRARELGEAETFDSALGPARKVNHFDALQNMAASQSFQQVETLHLLHLQQRDLENLRSYSQSMHGVVQLLVQAVETNVSDYKNKFNLPAFPATEFGNVQAQRLETQAVEAMQIAERFMTRPNYDAQVDNLVCALGRTHLTNANQASNRQQSLDEAQQQVLDEVKTEMQKERDTEPRRIRAEKKLASNQRRLIRSIAGQREPDTNFPETGPSSSGIRPSLQQIQQFEQGEQDEEDSSDD